MHQIIIFQIILDMLYYVLTSKRELVLDLEIQPRENLLIYYDL
jgi:hypothetical protein